MNDDIRNMTAREIGAEICDLERKRRSGDITPAQAMRQQMLRAGATAIRGSRPRYWL